jgi:hypothetical protein
MKQFVARVWKADCEVYGSRWLWGAAGRSGIDIGRDQTRRLMRTVQFQGRPTDEAGAGDPPGPKRRQHSQQTQNDSVGIAPLRSDAKSGSGRPPPSEPALRDTLGELSLGS